MNQASTDTTEFLLGLVPARAGSKRVPDKNIRAFAGRSLLDLAVRAAIDAQGINEIALTESRIEYLKEGLANSKNATVTTGLSNLLNSAYFSLVTLKSDQPYFVVIVDRANSSETPISPNIYIILFANFVTFLSLSAFISYFRANKEQIW